jgi:phage shock protein PspC (stress-responsive transcriptional regulator)
MVVFAVLGGLVFGFLLSLIISAIMKRNRPEFE